jgi:hypothetical protein
MRKSNESKEETKQERNRAFALYNKSKALVQKLKNPKDSDIDLTEIFNLRYNRKPEIFPRLQITSGNVVKAVPIVVVLRRVPLEHYRKIESIIDPLKILIRHDPLHTICKQLASIFTSFYAYFGFINQDPRLASNTKIGSTGIPLTGIKGIIYVKPDCPKSNNSNLSIKKIKSKNPIFSVEKVVVDGKIRDRVTINVINFQCFFTLYDNYIGDDNNFKSSQNFGINTYLMSINPKMQQVDPSNTQLIEKIVMEKDPETRSQLITFMNQGGSVNSVMRIPEAQYNDLVRDAETVY